MRGKGNDIKECKMKELYAQLGISSEVYEFGKKWKLLSENALKSLTKRRNTTR